MKKLCNILLLFVIFSNLKIDSAYANSSSFSGYAKAVSGCVLYRTETLTENEDNIIFEIPESYFVYVLEDVSESVCKVQYGRFVGYVNRSKIVFSTFVPIVKTLDGIMCDVKQTAGTQIWNIPSANGSVLTTISAGVKGLTYIASVKGKIPTGGKSDIWFYICYTPEFNSTHVYEGYVYSENITNLSPIVLNLETNPEILNSDYDEKNKTILISSSLKTILIVLMTVPIILLILIILYKLSKKISKNTNKTFFDDNVLNKHEVENQNNLFNGEKNKIDFSKLKRLSFVKRHGENIKNNYPEFPKYDSEDDWL